MKVAQRADPSNINWKAFKFMVFDVPNHRGTYAQRYDALGTLPPPPNFFLVKINILNS